MRLRNITGSREVIADSIYVVQEPQEKKGRWKEVFGNDHPVRIEIGMGKGKFLHTLAKENPDIKVVVVWPGQYRSEAFLCDPTIALEKIR